LSPEKLGNDEETKMTKTFKLGVAALVIATATPALAGNWNHHWNGPVAAGIVGGLALGAIASGAYVDAPYDDAPVYQSCYFARRPAYDFSGNFVGYRRVRVCE
jgi:hypothetical protein